MPAESPLRSHAGSPHVPASAPAWRLEGRRLFDDRVPTPATIDLDAPGAGIHTTYAADAAADNLLGVDLPAPWRLADHWARGADVTAVYESNDARHLRATAMWRLHPCGGGARGWQAIVSAQTSLLQSDSLLAVTSTVCGGVNDELLWGTCSGHAVRWQATARPDASCVLLRRTGGDQTSVLVAGHPGEVRQIESRRQNGRTAIRCWLFSPALEKGVMLRSRVLAAVGPAQADEAWATAAVAAFAALPPMLTT